MSLADKKSNDITKLCVFTGQCMRITYPYECIMVHSVHLFQETCTI